MNTLLLHFYFFLNLQHYNCIHRPYSYDLIPEAFKWLGVNYKKTYYKSDRLEIYYEYAEKLIGMNKAYVCHCSVEDLRKNRSEGVECSCRQFPKGIQHARWKQMFKAEMKEGQAILR